MKELPSHGAAAPYAAFANGLRLGPRGQSLPRRPSHDVFSPEFVRRFARYSAATARFIANGDDSSFTGPMPSRQSWPETKLPPE